MTEAERAPRAVTLEVRRHAERARQGDAHGALSAAGLAMARALWREDEHFALVSSSPRERARSTAAAMAGRVDETAPVLDVASDEVLTQTQYDALQTQEDVARFLGANASARRFADAQLAHWEATAKRLPGNGRGLVVTHGGNIELPAVLLATELRVRLGRLPLGYCEGVRVHYLHGRAAAVERLGAAPEVQPSPTFVPTLSVLRAPSAGTPDRNIADLMVRDRIYVGLQAAETEARLLHELRYPFGKLAGTMMWLDYYVAPTSRGCVIEVVERKRPHIVLLLVRWLPTFFAVMLALPYVIGIAVGRPPEGGALVGALATALAFQVITRIQARAIAWMLHERLPRILGRAAALVPNEITGPRERVSDHTTSGPGHRGRGRSPQL